MFGTMSHPGVLSIEISSNLHGSGHLSVVNPRIIVVRREQNRVASIQKQNTDKCPKLWTYVSDPMPAAQLIRGYSPPPGVSLIASDFNSRGRLAAVLVKKSPRCVSAVRTCFSDLTNVPIGQSSSSQRNNFLHRRSCIVRSTTKTR